MGGLPALLVAALGLALAAPAQDSEQDETCAADGTGCARLPVYPECEYSCNVSTCQGPGSRSRERIWPVCPNGPGGCRKCKDRDALCPRRVQAYGGRGCEENPSYMTEVCARSCDTCHLRNKTTRCKHLWNMPWSLEPGAINHTFQRILNMQGLNVKVLSQDPWLLKFPKFLTDEEVEFLKDATTRGPWTRGAASSKDDKNSQTKLTYSSKRTSQLAFCDCRCRDHPVAKRLMSRVGELLRVHPDYADAMQFLRYDEGTYHRAHMDAYRTDRWDPNNAGKHRVLTFFMYLNDVPKGGGTHFPRLGLTVRPERGSAALWPSVFNHDPWSADLRTKHGALEVEQGHKLAVNLWWHMGPMALAHPIGCTTQSIK